MRYLAPYFTPICYVLGILCLVLLFLFRNSDIPIVAALAICTLLLFYFGYTISKHNKEEAKYNFFPPRIHTEKAVYSMVLRFDGTNIIGYNGVPMLKSATELDIKKEGDKYMLYYDNQRLGYIPEDSNARKLADVHYDRAGSRLLAIIKKDGDSTFDIAAYSE